MRTRYGTDYSASNGFTAVNKPSVTEHDNTGEANYGTVSTPADRFDGSHAKEVEARSARSPLVANYLGLGGCSLALTPFENAEIENSLHPKTKTITGEELEHDVHLVKSSSTRGKAVRKPKIQPKQSVSVRRRVTKSIYSANDSEVKTLAADPTDYETRQVDKREADDFKLSDKTMLKLDAFRYNGSASAVELTNDLVRGAVSISDRVPVVAPVTSLDALKAQHGFGCTVYQGPSQSRRLQVPQKTHSTQQADWSVADSRPNHLGDTEQADQHELEPCSRNDEYPISVRQRSIPAANSTAVINAALAVPSPFASPLDEQPSDRSVACDIDEGLDDDDFLALLSETSPTADIVANRLRPRPASSESVATQLPTPRPSDPVLTMSSPGVDTVRGDQLHVTYGSDDESMVLDDGIDIASFDLSCDQVLTSNPAVSDLAPKGICRVPMTEPTQLNANRDSNPGAQYSSIKIDQHSEDCGRDGLRPITRPPFPGRVRDKSPVIGLSASTVLRTCFRVGEAINVGCQAVRAGHNVVIELYARVTSCWREPTGVRQHFVFADLFHNRPPYINGVYELWKGVELWNYDSQRFLDPSDSKMCRCIGKMRREDHRWRLTVLSVWEATWEDIGYVKGIICA